MYLVRTKDTKRLVGVFAASSPAGLFNIVDEELDPFSCEYFQMHPGHGLFVDGQFETRKDVESVEFTTIEPLDVLQASGVRMTEQLDLDIPAGARGWHAFTKKNLAAAFGVPVKYLDTPPAKALLEGNLGIYKPAK